MEQLWYKKSHFRNLVDMHINNGDERLLASFDAEAYAENMKTAGFDTAYIYASNCLGLCLYPTKTGYRHQIANKRDLFGETVKACRDRGIRPVGYLNNWSTEAYDRHPAWRVIGKDGSGHRDFPGHEGRYGVCCFNSPYRDYFLSLVKELCSSYPIEGLWVDMVGFWRTACYCESCREQFYQETGMAIPDIVDWESPAWRRYMKFKEDSLNRYARDITRTAKEARPGITVSIQSAGWTIGGDLGFNTGYFGEFDYSAGDFYTDVKDQAVDCKFLRGVTANQPFEYMVPRCPQLTYHTISKPMWQLRQQGYSALLHGGAFLCIDAIDPAGTLNSEVYRRFRQVEESLAPYWEFGSSGEGEYLNDAAVYMNYQSAIDLAQNGMSATKAPGGVSPLIQRLKDINHALGKRHIQYDIITDLKLSQLDKYPLVILSELYVLTQKEIGAFTEYVRNGGHLYVSGASGILRDIDAEPANGTLRRQEFALGDVMGVSLAGELPYDVCYVKGVELSELFDGEQLKYPLGTKGPGPKVSANEGTRVLAVAQLPFSNHTDGKKFVTAISDPPWEDTDVPVLTEHIYGKGKCVYSSLLLEADRNDAVSDLWLDIVEQLLRDRRKIVIDAPLCVEASVKTVKEGICISLLHTLAHETQSAAGDTRIWISGKQLDVESAESFPSGSITLEQSEEGTVICASGLPEFAMITVKGKKK